MRASASRTAASRYSSNACCCRWRGTAARGRRICWALPCSPDRYEERMTAPPDLPAFDTPQLAKAVEALPVAMLDLLPYGAIRVDAAGIVRVYSGAERRLSGSGDRP